MKISSGTILYVCAQDEGEGVALIDAIERSVNAQMSGDRQLLVSVESLEDALEESAFSRVISKKVKNIVMRARWVGASDVNIYC